MAGRPGTHLSIWPASVRSSPHGIPGVPVPAGGGRPDKAAERHRPKQGQHPEWAMTIDADDLEGLREGLRRQESLETRQPPAGQHESGG